MEIYPDYRRMIGAHLFADELEQEAFQAHVTGRLSGAQRLNLCARRARAFATNMERKRLEREGCL